MDERERVVYCDDDGDWEPAGTLEEGLFWLLALAGSAWWVAFWRLILGDWRIAVWATIGQTVLSILVIAAVEYLSTDPQNQD